jgi:CRISPR-associated protein Cmr5
MKTRSQYDAETAYARIREITTQPQDIQKQYGTLCHRFPVMVLRNGLAQTLGFLAAKAGGDQRNAHSLLLNHLARHLVDKNAQYLGEFVHQADLSQYRLLTRRALAVAIWYKRYAESLLEVSASDTADAGPESRGGGS